MTYSFPLSQRLVDCRPSEKYFLSSRGLQHLAGKLRRLPYELRGNRDRLVGIGTQGTFPDRNDPPAQRDEISNCGSVTKSVGIEFGLPEIAASPWYVEVGTSRMRVPETPIDKDRRTPFWKNEIGSSG